MTFDKIYEDITNNVLPKIAEGLTITKDYVTDVIQRHVQYLIISDTIALILSTAIAIILIIVSVKIINYLRKNPDNENTSGYVFLLIGTVSGIAVSVLGIFHNVDNLMKDAYVPELRIYELYQDKQSESFN